MTTIVTRAGKGSPLTNSEMDANLNNLNNDKLEAAAIANMLETVDIGTTVQAYDADTAKTDVVNVWTADQTLGAGRSLVFEGTTDDAYEGVLSSADVTNDRTWTLPDKSGTVAMLSDIAAQGRFTSADQTITAGGTLTIAHGLGVVPFAVNVFLKCTVADSGYSVNDVVAYSNIGQTSSSAADTYGYSMTIDATNINIKFGSAATNTLVATNKSTGVAATLLNTSWNLIVKAEA